MALIVPVAGVAADGSDAPARQTEPASPPPGEQRVADTSEQVGRSFREAGASVETGAKTFGYAVRDGARHFGRSVADGWRSRSDVVWPGTDRPRLEGTMSPSRHHSSGKMKFGYIKSRIGPRPIGPSRHVVISHAPDPPKFPCPAAHLPRRAPVRTCCTLMSSQPPE